MQEAGSSNLPTPTIRHHLTAEKSSLVAADAAYRRGIEVVDTFGARTWLARSRLGYAEFCNDRGRFDDARRLATQAHDIVEGTEPADSIACAASLLGAIDDAAS